LPPATDQTPYSPPRRAAGEPPIVPASLPEGFTLLQITPRLEGGGVERVTVDTALAVAAAGGVSLVASLGGKMEAQLAAGGGELIRLPVQSRNPLVMASNGVRLGDLIRARRISLVHVRSRAPAFSAIWAARATGIPVATTYHGIYQARSPLKRWYNAVMTRGDITIANSIFTRDHVMAEHRLDGRRLTVVPEGIDTAVFDRATVTPSRMAGLRAAWGLDPDDHRPVLLLAARLTGWKGQGVMIEAMSRLAGPSDPVLILAGKAERDEETGALRALAERWGVAGRVRLVGAVEDMAAAYRVADLVVAPSTLPESFGRSVVEAGAMERPVLASPLGGPGETVIHGQTGWLAPAGDPAAWAAAVDRALATTPETRANMGRAARARILSDYSLTAMTAATFAIYRRLLEAGR
jgi:glycosyltransferase involved in cell wall biosynthesis